MNAALIFQIVMAVLTEAPTLIQDVSKVVEAVKAFGVNNPTPSQEHVDAIKNVAKLASQ